ncbi:nuclear cap-binding protein subunit 1 isoform X2 [Mercurialis annua]|uniref:nuclear cap-binding protein subunit 1 isoform X2 n=1 Tax=Mercurialis annua TaxID=3986 RepID=UPI00215F00EE|nr:nuclear cap-binding protein subunit 1 isoform X2 [Mercurialis annua]
MSSWRSLLLRIGDKCPEYSNSTDHKEHIETCFGVVRRELEHSANDILHFLLQCAEQLPHKIPLYGTLVGLLNLEDEEFVWKVLEKIRTNFQDSLDSGNCDSIRILMRFLTAMMCSKVLQPASLVVLFETLLSSAATTVDEEKGNPSWQARGDFYVTCILSSLPWGGSELVEQVPEEIERIMVGVEAYLSIRRHNSDTGLSFFGDDDLSEKGLTEKDFLEDLWERIQGLCSNEWKLDSVPRPHLSFEAQLVAGKSHEFGPINAPEQPEPLLQLSGVIYGKQKHIAELKYPQRIRRLNIFPANKTEDMQPIDRFIVEEYLLDVLLFLNGCRKECASYMVGLPVTSRYEYLMAETIFSQLLLLPQPPFKPMYYTLVIMDLCKALPGAFPAVVAGAVRALFERIADLDMECRTRLILWFSHHLSNFQFIWPWEEWDHVLGLPKWAPQRVFVQEVLEREIRLSYWDKVKQSIENAPALEELLPPKGVPNFKYSTEDGQERSEQHALSAELSNKVKGRATAKDIISWVEESLYPHHGWEVTLSVVVQTLLDIGSKSFTHLITVLERYGQVIARICHDHDKQFMLIAEISSYWKNNTQMTAIAIDRMMGYRLLSNLAIIKWVFSPTSIEQFHTSDRPWEALFLSLYKNFSNVLMERLPEASKIETLHDLKSTQADEMAVDPDESSEMDMDNDNGRPKKSQSNGDKSSNIYSIGEKEQWCLSTLGYVKAFSRQYASEIWPLIEKLDAEVLTENAHPLFLKAVYDGLCRQVIKL